jgi:hypothetical protein
MNGLSVHPGRSFEQRKESQLAMAGSCEQPTADAVLQPSACIALNKLWKNSLIEA